MIRIFNVALMSFVLLSVVAPSYAQDKNLQNALAKAQYMLRQVNAEKLTAQQELETLKKEFEEYKKDMQKQLAQSESSVKNLKGSLGQWKESHGDVKEKLIEKHEALISETKQRMYTEKLLGKTTQEYRACHNANYELVSINSELLEKYRGVAKKGKDPVFGFGKVKMENMVQEYSHRIDDQLLENVLGYEVTIAPEGAGE